MGLAHLINAEAEKIQFVLGTLKGVTVPTPTISDLININEAVRKTIVSVIKEEMLLQFKLENILKIPTVTPRPPAAGQPPTCHKKKRMEERDNPSFFFLFALSIYESIHGLVMV
ncbi:hypothetical protein [Rossellomorea yichunensis]|uniref:hypothetical protein n=1 Tax=Rossellomorea yichunensis TaxID=3077331 RepID=UPI0028DF6753|nr:hypothetical protein [Rossellomorea sp. YC4-1]MDT9027826.1 hypothetical protein [Rossellomorea sp. YC4-1]